LFGSLTTARRVPVAMAVKRQELVNLVEPVIRAMGYELTDLELRVGHGRGLLRLFIDHPDGITVDDCETVSRQVGSVLDVEDPIAGGYTLEVSSPGLDRRLVKPADFDRFAGKDVQLRLRRLVDGRRRIQGTLLARAGEVITVKAEGVDFHVPLEEIEVARLVPDLSRLAKR
jgi:ribosome maturation factor RimP